MRGRQSTGKVKLKSAYGVLSFTVPKNQQVLVKDFVGDEFTCSVFSLNSDDLIIFTRVQPTNRLRLRLK